jgi:hypothetical protein
MNTEMSPRIRIFVSGLASVAVTGLLMSTLVESLNPAALTKRSVETSAPATAAAVEPGSYATLIRRV